MRSKREVREDIEKFLRRNFPQIDAHGGSSSIQEIDLEEKSVTIQLGGACSGCGVSPMTTNAIMNRLPKDVQEIDYVDVGTGMDGLTTETKNRKNQDRDIDAPF